MEKRPIAAGLPGSSSSPSSGLGEETCRTLTENDGGRMAKQTYGLASPGDQHMGRLVCAQGSLMEKLPNWEASARRHMFHAGYSVIRGFDNIVGVAKVRKYLVPCSLCDNNNGVGLGDRRQANDDNHDCSILFLAAQALHDVFQWWKVTR
ncbi:hypothetical protein PCH_Pc21g14170 [Penicillium rubens Wisconsin 54-1255]|uniref:Uncharacterized protein n=1 Tax=Penicillium rubens (strain ATCC 28089 / DSM 1075 / NRRL 1951 / Wisconsin 54-1255) TaxID=500485 RepID=B6HHP0_PENRW|nr:hypothetical protein PCH_Pc21g14170 [Penicillium rubens Wisconsin 54-1255]